MGIWGVITLGLSWLLAAQVAALETPQVAALAKTRALPGDEHIKAMADAMRQLAANLDGLKFDPPEPVGTGVKSDLGEGLQVPPAPPPGPAPNDVTQALLEAQASADEKKEQAKMYVKPPGCRPTTSAELRDYAGYKTNCARLQRQTPVSLKVTNLKVTQISEAREEISVVLTLHLSWMDPAIATHSVESLWSPNIDFLDVVISVG